MEITKIKDCNNIKIYSYEQDSGLNLSINYSFHQTQFGKILLASTYKGLCYSALVKTNNIKCLYALFPNSICIQKIDKFHINSLIFFDKCQNDLSLLYLHLKGTNFQIKVWKALLQIPTGKLTTYSKIASIIGNPKASRAVGNAIAKNPICFIIPCHRVIKNNGNLGKYAYGANIKQKIIDWEKSYFNNII